MEIKRFNFEKDKDRINNFLAECYAENKDMTCWLPARFEDLIYRIDTLYKDERGKKANQDYIFYFEENGKIVAAIFPDGDSFNTSIKKGYEYLFKEMLDLGEKELLPLFEKNEDGSVNFLVISHDSLKYQAEELIKRGYKREEESDYDNMQKPLEKDYVIELPKGYKQVYGYDLNEHAKSKACHYGFHPVDDDGILEGDFREGSLSYQARKKSRLYNDSFESLIVTDDGDICSYCFCYVDKNTSTAFIEPVCTREKYRMKGLCKQMLHGVIIKLKEMNIQRAYINSYAWRRKVYNSAGFETQDVIGFWTKKI